MPIYTFIFLDDLDDPATYQILINISNKFNKNTSYIHFQFLSYDFLLLLLFTLIYIIIILYLFHSKFI